MANGGAVSLDTVMIKIESDAGKASSNISKLADTLRDLKSATSGGYNNLNKLSNALNNLKDGSKSLTSVVNNISKLETVTQTLTKLSNIKAPSGLRQTIKRLNELSDTSKTLYTTAYRLSSIDKIVLPLQALTTIGTPTGLTAIVKNLNALSNLGSIDNIVSEMSKIPQIVEPLSKLGTIIEPKGFKTAVTNIEKLPEVISKFDTTTFENLKRVSNELAQSLTPLAEKMMQVANGYSAFSKIQNTFGKSASTSYKYLKQNESVLSSLGNAVKNVSSGFMHVARNIQSAFGKKVQSDLKSFYSKFKQIYLSLLGTRTIFTLVRKAASEYQAFDTTLQKFSQNIWRAFGAQLAPVIEYAMNLFKQFVRVVYSVVYALTGIDLIARANEKAMQSWGESAKDTLGNLQKFDDLNVVEFPKANGDDKELIEMDKIDLTPIQKVIDWVKKLKEEIQAALDTGEWYNVGKVFAEGISEGISFLNDNIHVVRNTLYGIANDVGDMLNGIIENTKWDEIGEFITNALILIPDVITELLRTIHWDEIGKGINDFFKTFRPASVIHSIAEVFRAALQGFGEMLSELDWSIIGPKISDALVTFFKDISAIIDAIPWSEIGDAIRQAIENVNWEDVWDGIVSGLSEALKGINEFIESLTGIDDNTLKGIEVALAGIGAAFVTYKIIKNLKEFAGWLEVIGLLSKSSGLVGLGIKFAGIGVILAGVVLTVKSILDFLEDPTWGNFLRIIAGIAIVIGGIAILAGGWIVAIVAAVVAGIALLASYIADNWEEIKKWWSNVVDTVSGWFSDLGKSISDLWNDITKSISDFLDGINKSISDFWNGIKTWWEEVKKWWSDKIDDFTKWFDDNLVKPILEFVENLKNGIKEKIEAIEQFFTDVKDWIDTKINDIKKIIQPIADWIYNKMIKPIKDRFNDLKQFVTDMWESLKGGPKSFANFVLQTIESFINNMIKGLNKFIKAINKISWDVPDWVPNIGGQKWGFSIKEMSEVSLPRLETGTNEIPYEGIYHLHPGEAVIPKKYNPALGNGNSDEMIAKMDTLIDVMNNLGFTNVVNIGNEKLYEKQQSFNKRQQNKYGTINLY